MPTEVTPLANSPLAGPAEAQVQADAGRVISILQARLAGEISQHAITMAALQAAQEREQQLAQALHEMREQAQQPPEAARRREGNPR